MSPYYDPLLIGLLLEIHASTICYGNESNFKSGVFRESLMFPMSDFEYVHTVVQEVTSVRELPKLRLRTFSDETEATTVQDVSMAQIGGPELNVTEIVSFESARNIVVD